MNLDQHRLCVELQRLNWARELKEEVIRDIVASAGFMELQAGQVIIALDSHVTDVYFVIAGRLEGALFDRLGKEIHCDTFRRGSVVGLFSVLLPDRSSLHVEAAEHTTVIHLGLDDLLRLAAQHREFQLAMLRIAANLVKHLVMVDRELPRPAAVGVVHHSDASRPLAVELARRLRQLGESPCVAGDDQAWRPGEGIPHRRLFEDGVSIGPERIKEVLKEWVSHERLFIDFRAEHSPDDLGRMLGYADVVLWCLRPRDVEAALRTLNAVEHSVPRLREKVCLVWILDHDAPVPPYVRKLQEFAARDFKTYSGDLQPNRGKLLQRGGLPPLRRHAVVPLTFQSWVSGMTLVRLPENLLPAGGRRFQVTQRTLVSISRSHDWPAAGHYGSHYPYPSPRASCSSSPDKARRTDSTV